MSQGAKNQIFEWDADSAKVIAELTKVAQEIRKLRKEAVDLNKTQIEGKQVDHARVQENLKDLASKLNAQEKLRVSLRQMRGDMENVNQAQRTYNAQTLTAAYAIDDFITVASMQDWSLKGMAAGISAAANNRSAEFQLIKISETVSISPQYRFEISEGDDGGEAGHRQDISSCGLLAARSCTQSFCASENIAQQQHQFYAQPGRVAKRYPAG